MLNKVMSFDDANSRKHREKTTHSYVVKERYRICNFKVEDGSLGFSFGSLPRLTFVCVRLEA